MPFHSVKDPTYPDIVSDKSIAKGNKNWSGTFLDLQNQPKYKCVNGNVFDLKGVLLGQLDENNKLDCPIEKSLVATKDDQTRGTGLDVRDINVVLGEGLTFVGTGKNKEGQEYPLHFTTGPDTNSGTWMM